MSAELHRHLLEEKKHDVELEPIQSSNASSTRRPPIDIAYASSVHSPVYTLLKYGGYLNEGYCAKIYTAFILWYHACNIAFAIWTFVAGDQLHWCLEFQITLFFIQLGAFTLYCVAYWALNCHCKHQQIEHVEINKKLRKTYKSPPKCVHVLLVALYLTTWSSGIVTWIDSVYWAQLTNVTSIRAILQLVLYILDVFKWMHSTLAVLIIYAFLNTFPEELDRFKVKLEATKMSEYVNAKSHRGKSTNVSFATTATMASDKTSAFHPEHNPQPMMQFNERLTAGAFMKRYNEFAVKYRAVLSIFSEFIAVFGVFNIIVWLLLVFTVCIYFNEDRFLHRCTDKNLLFFFMHYASEIALYFASWMLILYRLGRNHALIDKYKTQFIDRYVPPNHNTDDYNQILKFLQNQLDKRSPFAIFGCIIPTWRKFALLFTSILVPMSFGIYQFIDQ